MRCHLRKGVSGVNGLYPIARVKHPGWGCQRLAYKCAGARTVRIAPGQLCALIYQDVSTLHPIYVTVQQADHIRKHTNTNKTRQIQVNRLPQQRDWCSLHSRRCYLEYKNALDALRLKREQLISRLGAEYNDYRRLLEIGHGQGTISWLV